MKWQEQVARTCNPNVRLCKGSDALGGRGGDGGDGAGGQGARDNALDACGLGVVTACTRTDTVTGSEECVATQTP